MENSNVLNVGIVVEGISSVAQSMYTEAAETVVSILDDIENLTDNDVLRGLREAVGAAGDTVEALKILKKIYDIPTAIFMHKFKKYCRGLMEIPLEKRQSYLEKTEEISRKEETLFVLNVLNKIEDADKIHMTIRLLEAKMDGDLKDNEYRRLLIMTGATLHSDLLYMGDNINHENFPLKDDAQEGLLGNGWIMPVGVGWSEFDESETTNLFAYNLSAKRFCRIVFGKDIEVTPPSNAGLLQAANSEDVSELFTSDDGLLPARTP